jgi:hypothetical protein
MLAERDLRMLKDQRKEPRAFCTCFFGETTFSLEWIKSNDEWIAMGTAKICSAAVVHPGNEKHFMSFCCRVDDSARKRRGVAPEKNLVLHEIQWL